MVENTPKPVTRKPTWATGVLLPALAGVPFGSFFGISTSMYAFGGWQALCGVAVAAKHAPRYRATSAPQGQRLAQLLGATWVGTGLITVLAGKEVKGSNNNNNPTMGGILAAIVASMAAFSICAGPTRLTDANDEEMRIIPINSFLVSWAATSLFGQFF